MMTKQISRKRRQRRIRKKLVGTEERPRLSCYRSLKNLYVQIIDDLNAKTIFAFSTADKDFVKKSGKAPKAKAAAKLGEFYADKLKEKGITKLAFDRGGYKYHGRIKALAESLREKGIHV